MANLSQEELQIAMESATVYLEENGVRAYLNIFPPPKGKEYSVKDIIDELLEVTGYRDYIQTIAETDDEYRERIANIDELINGVRVDVEEGKEYIMQDGDIVFYKFNNIIFVFGIIIS